ncbi:Putative amino acid permease/ SLC12A domain-containing protein [Septoria linicola]|uniref:Amino acid permease/ SLC12A domain-containing protein n=1 Tax=Septoria linicola TaxID=215465 RepID=A0A9Q9AZ79_9PEZI|nr:Putative amino acid permease/ SLC12A domain-containing protein [Septoria linicola]
MESLPSKSPAMDIQANDDKVERGEVLPVSTRHHDNGLRRDLKRRHINMIAIAGTIGTGLFLAPGNAIATGGPVGALFGYIVMGLITWAVALMTGDISAFMPVTGGFPALGTATGWNFWYTMAITAPAEISAAATVINFWNTSISPAVWFSIFIVVIMALNFSPVKVYGENEVFFAVLKISLIIGLIIAGIVVDLGGGPDQDRTGFRYWKSPGPFAAYLDPGNTGKFLGFWSTLISAAYSYANVQVIALAGAETQNPRKVIPNAVRMTFWRVMIFYVLSIFVVGLLVPSNDPNLGISNASRTLIGLAEEGQAPAWFLRTNRFGTPYLAVSASLIFTPLVYLALGSSSGVVFGWFVNITTIAGLIGWLIICVTYLRFFYGMRAQGTDRDGLPYKSPLQPYAAWTTLVALVVVILTSGYSGFFSGRWDVSSCLTYYIDIAIFISLWMVSLFFFRAKPVSLSDTDLSEIYLIEQERSEAKQMAILEEGFRDSWWRRWLI